MNKKRYKDEKDLEFFLREIKKINLKNIPEEYGDFCIEINNFRAVIELKRIEKTAFENEISKLNKPFVSTFNPYLLTDDANHLKLDDISNTKAKKVENNKDPKYYSATYIGLITVEKDPNKLEEKNNEQEYNQWDIKISRFFLILISNPSRWIPCLSSKNGKLIDKERKRYFIPKQYQNENEKENQQLKYVDYFGILRKNLNFNKWRFELIENPFIKKERRIPKNLLTSTLDFIDIFSPEWL